jgi:hypothetical protein
MRLGREKKPPHSYPTPDLAKVGLEGQPCQAAHGRAKRARERRAHPLSTPRLGLRAAYVAPLAQSCVYELTLLSGFRRRRQELEAFCQEPAQECSNASHAPRSR